jgi:hypothetical protein
VATTSVAVPINENVTLAIGQKIKVAGLDIILNSFVQDSRCPIDVVCIQAGAVNVNVTLADSSRSITKNFSSDEVPYSFGIYRISIVDVAPPRQSQKEILPSQYRITFHVVSDVAPVPKSSTVVNGKVTLSPTCPVERIPPDPQCAPKPYATSIQIFSVTGSILTKTVKSDVNGNFTVTLPFGDYKIQAVGGNPYPHCGEVPISVKTIETVLVNISCDTGIR